MAFPTKDGKKKFGSKFASRSYDERHVGGDAPKAGESDMGLSKPKVASEPKAAPKTDSEGMAHEAKESPEFEAGEKEGQGENQSPAQVVAKNGPAHTVTVHHDHANKKHKVVSHHGGGFMHESDHGSPEEAHNTGKQLAGADQGQEQSTQGGMGQSEPDGFSMPQLG